MFDDLIYDTKKSVVEKATKTLDDVVNNLKNLILVCYAVGSLDVDTYNIVETAINEYLKDAKDRGIIKDFDVKRDGSTFFKINIVRY